jgi:hypothetical protein
MAAASGPTKPQTPIALTSLSIRKSNKIKAGYFNRPLFIVLFKIKHLP